MQGKGTRFDVYPALYATALVVVLSLWHRMALQGSSLRAVVASALLAGLSLAYGRMLARATGLSKAGHSTLTLEFLSGYLLLNTILFVLIVASPLGMIANLVIVGAGGLAVFFVRRESSILDGSNRDPLSLLALVLCAIAATLWCTDGLTPPIRDGSGTTFQLWSDFFVHARLISTFAHAHGLASMSDLRMWGVPAYLYHYASYAVPAAASALTKVGAAEVFAAFFLPFGVLLSGLAAYAFGASLWGRGAGVAGAAALLLVPDADQQGFGAKYLSYNFMQQVNTAGLYGVACMAVAWTFVLQGCRSRRIVWIVIGWAIAFIALPYKAHVFVANAFLIMIYPCLFFPQVRTRWRVGIAAILIACFAIVVALSQRLVDRVPTLRLDGSGARPYVAYLLANQDDGWMKSFIEHGLGAEPWSQSRLVLYGSALVLLGTFGAWIVVALAAVFLVRKKQPAAIWAFPLFVIANYLIMALGLAMDSREIGSPDELLNRPLVWAYFAIAAWTGGAVYWLLFGEGLPRTALMRAVLGFVALVGFAVPLRYAHNLQTFPHWQGVAAFNQGAVPTCLIRAARFIRDHSPTSDVVQDSENDPHAWVTAFTERPDFVMDARVHPPPGLAERLADVAALKRLDQAAEIKAFAVRNHVAWYLLQPASAVGWPQNLRDEAVFECNGYRVFHFVP